MNSVELRKMNCELSPLTRPDGSALFTLGDTVVLSAVYGPVEVKPQKLQIENATIEVVFKPKSGFTSVSDKLKEATLANVFKTAILSSQHPRSCISIIVQEMQDCGGLLACAINSACLALMNAGIPLKFLVAAVTCMINSQDEIILDPNSTQLKESNASFTFVFDSIDKNLVACETMGSFSTQRYEGILSTCRDASKSIFQFYHDVINKSTMDYITPK